MYILKTIYKILEKATSAIVMFLLLVFFGSYALESLGVNDQPFGEMTTRIRAIFVSIEGAKVRNSIESYNGKWSIDANGVVHAQYIVLEPQDEDVFNTNNPSPENGTILFFDQATILSFWQNGYKRNSTLTSIDDWAGQITYQFVSYSDSTPYVIKAAQVN